MKFNANISYESDFKTSPDGETHVRECEPEVCAKDGWTIGREKLAEIRTVQELGDLRREDRGERR